MMSKKRNIVIIITLLIISSILFYNFVYYKHTTFIVDNIVYSDVFVEEEQITEITDRTGVCGFHLNDISFEPDVDCRNEGKIIAKSLRCKTTRINEDSALCKCKIKRFTFMGCL